MRIVSGRWSELGSPTEPGDCPFEYEKEQLRVRVMPQDIEEAKANGGPDAVFRASGPEKDTGVYLIGRFRPPIGRGLAP
jgi:hypothetical protein